MKSLLDGKKSFSALLAAVLILGASVTTSIARADTAAVEGDPAATENRIKELHDKLKIQQAQEDLWTKVSQEMRDHAKAAQALIATRNQNAKTMTAIDDLKSYSEIATLHADGMKHFLDVFTPLYTAMSDDQKKNADLVFREHQDARQKKHLSALKATKRQAQ